METEIVSPEKQKLRDECSRLFLCKTINDCYDVLDIYIEILFFAVKNHHKDPVNNQANADAKIIAQMMLTKALHLKTAANGISYSAKDGTSLNRIIDPTVVACLIRNIYETVGIFNLGSR